MGACKHHQTKVVKADACSVFVRYLFGICSVFWERVNFRLAMVGGGSQLLQTAEVSP